MYVDDGATRCFMPKVGRNQARHDILPAETLACAGCGTASVLYYTCETGMFETENIEFYACITAWYSMNCQEELQKLRNRSKVQ